MAIEQLVPPWPPLSTTQQPPKRGSLDFTNHASTERN